MRYRLMATYRGVPYEAGIGPTGGDVVLFAACPPPEELGFEPATGHWRKRVIRAEVDAVWESRPVGTFRGEQCLVLDDLGDRLHIAYLGDDGTRATQLGYWQVDRGVYELLTPRDDVTGLTEERVDKPLLQAPPQPQEPPPSPPPEAPPPPEASLPPQASLPPEAPPPPEASLPASTPPFQEPAEPQPLLFQSAELEVPLPGPAVPSPRLPDPPEQERTPEQHDAPGLIEPLGLEPAVLSEPPGLSEPPDLPEPPELSEPPQLSEPPDLPEPPGLSEPPELPEPPEAAEPPRAPVTQEAAEPPGAQEPAEPQATSGPADGGRSARRQRVSTRDIFIELADMAGIPRAAYALEAEADGAMCLLPSSGGFEVFMASDGIRHEERFFPDEETAYFYLFGVLAAEAIRNGTLAAPGAVLTRSGS